MDPVEISREQVRHVARLARLEVSDEQVARYSVQLGSILQYVAKISEVDVSAVEPMAHVLPLTNVFREDEVGPSLPLEDVLRNAPDTDPPFFKVPKIIGADDDSAG